MITVKQCKSDEVESYKEKKYQEFLKLYLETNTPVRDIFKIIKVNNTNSTARYIRNRIRREGYSSDIRWRKIKRREWV